MIQHFTLSIQQADWVWAAGPALRNQEREGEMMLIPQRRSFGACSGFLIDTCPFRTRRCTKLRITRLWLVFLLWEAAWLRRDAIASYVCLVCCNLQLNNSKSQAKPRIIPNSKLLIRTPCRPTQYLHFWCSILWVERTKKSLVRNSWVLSVQR